MSGPYPDRREILASMLGSAAAPVRIIHDRVSQAVYGGVRGGLRAMSRAGATAMARRHSARFTRATTLAGPSSVSASAAKRP